eukprot:SAG31_NODE_5591_length_2437_cov_1.515398_1_plen_41_part_00
MIRAPAKRLRDKETVVNVSKFGLDNSKVTFKSGLASCDRE